MAIKLAAATLSYMAQGIINATDAGTGPGTIAFYGGAQPPGPGTAVGAQPLLGTVTLSDPCATESGGVVTFSPITMDSEADATGTATWARMLDSNGLAVADYDVGNEASAAALKLNTTSIVIGGPILITSLSITIGA
jgi:hypothetical protein